MRNETNGNLRRFGDLLEGGPRNGIYKTKEFHGRGHKIVNMGELFAYPILRNVPMKRVELTASEDERFSLNAGDLLFARRSLVAEGAGKCCLVREIDEPTAFESSIIRVRPRPECASSGYLFYYFSSPDGLSALDSIRRQLAVSGITGTDLVELRVPVPPLREQRAIGSLLGALDDKLELNRRVNRELEALASALFKSWFVDFDPVVAKRDGKTPVGVPADALHVFPGHFDDSELGPIPQGWQVARLGDLAELNARTLSPKDALSEIRYVEISDVHRGDVDNITVYARGSEPSRARRLVRDGDTVVSTVRPERGAYFLCLEPPLNLVVSTGFVVLTPRAGRWALVYCAATSDDALDHYELHAEGGAYPAMRPEAVSSLRLAMPPGDAICKCFCSIVNPLLKHADANRDEARRLVALRDALLPPLLSGEITIKTAEKTVAEVV